MSSRPRNLELDALVKLAGLDPYTLSSKARKTWQRFQRCLDQIKEVFPDVTVDFLREAYHQHVKTWPTIRPVTPESLAKHIGQLMAGKLAVLPGKAIVEPTGWRERIAEILPEEDYGATGWAICKKEWPAIPTHLQMKVIARMAEITGDGKVVRFPHANVG